MKTTLYNYSSLINRETKLYAIGGTAIPGGMSISFLKVVIPLAAIFTLLGFGLSFILRINMFDFLGKNWNWRYMLSWPIIGAAIGLILWNVQFAGYRLFEYLMAYLRKRNVYTNTTNLRNRLKKFVNVKITAIIKQNF